LLASLLAVPVIQRGEGKSRVCQGTDGLDEGRTVVRKIQLGTGKALEEE